MMSETTRTHHYLRVLVDARAIILGVSLLHLVVTFVWVLRWYQRLGNASTDYYPNEFLTIPLVLVLASLMLMISRWWSYVLAFVASGWVIYLLGYAALRAASIARDVPLPSSESLRVWFATKYIGQPQEFLQLALAFSILSYVVVTLLRHRRSGSVTVTTTHR